MKKLTLLVIGLMLSLQFVLAQSSQGINYQLVLRDGNSIIANQAVNLLYAVEDRNAAILYEESTNATTNKFGQVTIVIGDGTPVIGSFDQIDWSQGGLQFEIEVTYNGTIYSLGRKPFESVPYAFFANSAAVADSAAKVGTADKATFADSAAVAGSAATAAKATDMVLNDLLDVSATPTTDGQLMVWNGTEWVANVGVLVRDTAVFATEYYSPFGTPGLVQIGGPNGTANVVLTGADDANAGRVIVADTASFIGALMDVAPEGEGRIISFDPTGNLNFIMGGVGTDPESGAVSVYDEAGDGRAIMGAAVPGGSDEGFVETYGSNGSLNVSTLRGSADHGGLLLADENSAARVTMEVGSMGEGRIETLGPAGTPNVTINTFGNSPNAGTIFVRDSVAGFSAGVGIFGDFFGNGGIQTTGSNGFANFTVASSPFGGSNDKGAAYVSDSTGLLQAGMYIDAQNRGIIFGDVKNFRTEYPNKPGKEIWYASLEGAEAAAYARGTATLVNGEVTVTFADHFQAIANPQTMTVSLTPLSAESEGLAVIEKTVDGFKVKELRKGQGNYSFDWEVKCVRKGYENFRVVRDAPKATPNMHDLNTSSVMQPQQHQQVFPAKVQRTSVNMPKENK
jgi:hypothetical protein